MWSAQRHSSSISALMDDADQPSVLTPLRRILMVIPDLPGSPRCDPAIHEPCTSTLRCDHSSLTGNKASRMSVSTGAPTICCHFQAPGPGSLHAFACNRDQASRGVKQRGAQLDDRPFEARPGCNCVPEREKQLVTIVGVQVVVMAGHAPTVNPRYDGSPSLAQGLLGSTRPDA